MPAPLSGLKVLDLSRVLAGPFATMLLADMGADVVKVEIPGKGDDTRGWGPPFIHGESVYFLSVNRNKRSIALDLKNPRALEILRELACKADVLVENFRPGTMEKLTLGEAALRELNPRLVFGSISGFGTSGPLKNSAGYDLIAQGMGGFMSITGEEGGGPLKVGLPIADLNAGMFLTMGILAALVRRGIDNVGQRVDTSLLEGQVAQLVYQAGRFWATGVAPGPEGNVHPLISPYQTYRAADGHINVAVGNDSLFARFCKTFQLEALLVDPRFATNADRVRERKALDAVIAPMLARMTIATIAQKLAEAGVPSGPILTLDQVLAHPQVLARDMVIEVDHPTAGRIKLTGTPVKFTPGAPVAHRPPPALGEHAREILADWLGQSPGEIEALAAQGLIPRGGEVRGGAGPAGTRDQTRRGQEE